MLPSNSLLRIYPKVMKSLTQKGICTPIVTETLLKIDKAWKLSMYEWVKEL